MSPELIVAIRERIAVGQSREEIETAVLAMGYTKEVCDAAYAQALRESASTTTEAMALPKVTSLFVNAWNRAIERLDLTLFLALPLFISSGVSFLFDYDNTGSDTPPLPLALLFAAAGIAYLSALIYSLFVVTRNADEEVTPKQSLSWVAKHFLPLLFLYVLSGLAIVGGFIFFFIPGFIVLIMVTFAQFSYVVEGKRGMAALLQSRAHIKGRFFRVAGKIAGFAFLSLLPAILLGMASGLLESLLGDGEAVLLISELATQALSAFLTVVNLYAMYELYQALSARGAGETAGSFTSARYWSLVFLALSFIVTLILMAFVYKEAFTWIEETERVLDVPVSGATIPTEFSTVQAAAETFYDTNATYTGVCDVLTPLIESTGAVTCNESESAWALATMSQSGESFCTDTTTPGKKISVELGEKTECFAS